jgi:hypothetical protein
MLITTCGTSPVGGGASRESREKALACRTVGARVAGWADTLLKERGNAGDVRGGRPLAPARTARASTGKVRKSRPSPTSSAALPEMPNGARHGASASPSLNAVFVHLFFIYSDTAFARFLETGERLHSFSETGKTPRESFLVNLSRCWRARFDFLTLLKAQMYYYVFPPLVSTGRYR